MVSIRAHKDTTVKRYACAVALLWSLVALPAFAETQPQSSASETVKTFYSGLTDTMKQGQQLGFNGRFKKLDSILNHAFNLPMMARMSVGLGWNNATPAEQQQIVSAFSDYSVATYARQFVTYDGEKFTVTDEKPAPGGEIVETMLTTKTGHAVPINYLMRQDDNGNWRIVDVFLDGAISEVATKRAEFSAVIKRDGIPALVNTLNEKSKATGPS